MEFLLNGWREFGKDEHRAPALCHRDLDLAVAHGSRRARRDVDEIVDDEPGDSRASRLRADGDPAVEDKVVLYEKDEPIFDHYKVEAEIEALPPQGVARERRLHRHRPGRGADAIDVNTGNFTGKKDLEETIVKTNLEAAPEVVKQLRLRSIGGIIIIDFIDMDRAENREKVQQALNEALRGAVRAKSNVTRISQLGLVEMSRKRDTARASASSAARAATSAKAAATRNRA